MNYDNVKFIVEEALPNSLFEEWKVQLLADLKIKKLWGVEQPVGFPRMMVTLCIYKDLSGYGYAKILSLINFGFQIKKKSFIHNCKLV